MIKLLLQLLAVFLNALAKVIKSDAKPIPLCHVYGKYSLEAPAFVGHVNAPTMITGSASSITTTSFTMGGTIDNTGGANPTVRGFAYVTGAGGTPTISDSVVNESGSFGTGAYSLGISGLAPGTTYSVRAYATNSAGTGYGSTVEVTTVANLPPTVALNSPADLATGISTTPTLEFTGTDVDGDDVRYQAQIKKGLFDISLLSGTSNVVLTSFSDVQHRGIAVTIPDGTIKKVRFWLGKVGTPTVTVRANVWEVTGTVGTNAIPNTSISPVAQSTNTIDQTDITTTVQEFIFEFDDFLPAGNYAIGIKIDGASTTGSGNYVVSPFLASGDGIVGANFFENTVSGLVATGVERDQIIEFSGLLIDVTSETPTPGFANTVTPADTDPFNSGEKVDYDVQAGDALTAGETYYWRVRGLDPTGSNTYGAWSATRSFTVSDSAQTETHTIDSLVKAEVTNTHTADSLVKAEVENTHTIDSYVNVQQTNTHTVDALVKAEEFISHSVDSYVDIGLVEETETHTVDSLVKEELVNTQTIDSLVKAEAVEVHTVDSLVKAEETNSHTTDSFVLAELTNAHTTDSLVKAELTNTHTTDSFVQEEITNSHTVDSFVLAEQEASHTLDSFVADDESGQCFLLLEDGDVILNEDGTKIRLEGCVVPPGEETYTHTVDSLVKTEATQTHTTDSLVKEELVNTHTVDSLVKAEATATHTVDSLAKEELTNSHTTDSLVKTETTQTHTADSLVKVEEVNAHTTDSFVKAEEVNTHTVDALVKTETTNTHTVDALVKAENTVSHTTDSFVKAELTNTHTVDSLVLAEQTISHTVDSFVFEAGQVFVDTSVDSLVLEVKTETHTVDSLVYNRETVTHTIDSLIKAPAEVAHTVDSFVVDPTISGKLFYREGGVWKPVTIKQKQAGVWQPVSLKYKKAGTWINIT